MPPTQIQGLPPRRAWRSIAHLPPASGRRTAAAALRLQPVGADDQLGGEWAEPLTCCTRRMARPGSRARSATPSSSPSSAASATARRTHSYGLEEPGRGGLRCATAGRALPTRRGMETTRAQSEQPGLRVADHGSRRPTSGQPRASTSSARNRHACAVAASRSASPLTISRAVPRPSDPYFGAPPVGLGLEPDLGQTSAHPGGWRPVLGGPRRAMGLRRSACGCRC
jgi:hypothetical protein